MHDRHTVPALIGDQVRVDPDAQFLVTDDDVLTYRDLDDATARVAHMLAAAGVAKGTRVGLLMPNGIDFAVLAFATMRMGAVLVPLSTLLRPPELRAQLVGAGVQHLLLAREFRGRDYVADLHAVADGFPVGADDPHFDARLPQLRAAAFGDDAPRVAAAPSSRDLIGALDASVRPADDMVVIFTSGSRGAPKGVIHTHGGALGAVEASLEPRCLGRGDRLYIPMPFFWMGGFGGGLMSAFVAGATLITEAEPEPTRTLRLLERERVTLFRGWPDQAAALAAHVDFPNADLTSLKAGSLEAMLPPDEQRPPGARSNLFGMTESFGPYCADRLDTDLPEGKWGSCGRPFPSTEVRVVDVESGTRVAVGEIGEIQIRGPNLMRGICGRLRSDVFTVDGFFPTGDLGALDGDGYLMFVGRRDDMVKLKGASVYPSEVETALHTIEGVRRAFVVDLPADDAIQLGAVVVLTPGSSLTRSDLAHEARARLSAFKVPTHWAIVDAHAIPTTATGKIDKVRLQGIFEHGR